MVLIKDGDNQLEQSCKNEAVLYSLGLKEHPTYIKQRKAKWIGHILYGKCLLKHVTGRQTGGTRIRGRRCKQLLDELKEIRRY